MKRIATISTLLVGVLLVAGCLSSGDQVSRPDTDDSSIGGEVTTAVAINESGTAGDAVHIITFVEVLDEIPEDYTLPEWEIISESMPAAEGFKWLRVKGEVTNNGSSTSSLDSTNVYARDAEGNEYSVSTDTTIYVDSDQSPVYIDLQPGQTKPWEGYFLVPADAEDLELVANDLSFLPESEVVVDLDLKNLSTENTAANDATEDGTSEEIAQ